MARKIVAELLLDILEEAGVERMYGVVGDSLNGMIDTIRRRGRIRWIPLRHEEVGAFAAGAEAHLTGGLTVCAGSCGPGNMHLINGLYDAHRSRVSVLAIAAQIPSVEIGSGYFQETNPQHLFQECSHYCELVSTPSQMPRTLEIALQTAITKRGVSVVILSGDTAMKEVPEPRPRLSFKTPAAPVLTPSEPELERLAGLLNAGKKITILGGAGCAGAHFNLIGVAGKLKAPIVHALRGKEHIEHDNPYDVGLTGLLGFSSGYFAMMSCDVLLMLGTDFPYRQFYPEKAVIIQIDRRGENLGRRTRLDLGLIGDVNPTLEALLPLLEDRKDRSHLNQALAHYKKTRRELDELAVGVPGRKPIHPQYLTKVLDDLAAPDAIFSCDVGTPTVWAARYLTMNGGRRLLGSFVHGSMANAMPQAIGAQSAFPRRQVVSMSGDGGFAMLMGDLLTIKQLKLPIKIVIFNNGSLGFVELEMKAAGLLEHGTDLENPNFARLAEAVGIHGIRLEDPAEVENGLRDALRHDGPVVVDAVVNRLELSMPPTIQVKQALGFSLYAIKAVMNGRGDKVLNLARTNLWR